MRKVLISIAVAASALAVASPAAAQWFPPPQQAPYGYAQPYGHGLNLHQHARALQARVDRAQHEIRRLAQYRMISRREHVELRQDAREIERRLRRDVRDGYGINPRELQSTERRIVRLEQKIARDARDGRRWGHNGRYDRDRDGRDDRWERDRD